MVRPGRPVRNDGPPRSGESARRPAAAERVRTLVESNASGALTIPGLAAGARDDQALGHSPPEVRAVAPSGDIYLLVPAGSPAARAAAHAAGEELAAVMDLTDVAPVSVPHRIRGRGWIAGWLTAARRSERAWAGALLARRHPTGPMEGPHWALLRMEMGEGYTDDLWGAARVGPEEFAAAESDPVSRHEADLLQHLASCHGERLAGLAGLLSEEERGRTQGRRVVPLSLDRFGLRVRFCGAGPGCYDARFDFPEPVRDAAGLRRALRRLLDAAA